MEGIPETAETEIKPRGGRNRETQAGVNIVVGKRGFGKTFFVENYILKSHTRNLLVSPLQDDYPSVQPFYDLEHLVDYMNEHRVYRIKTPLLHEIDNICRIAWHFGNLNLVLEESNRVIGNREELSIMFSDVLLRGRHRNIDLTLVSQRFSAININVRSQFTRIFAFNQSEKADVKALEEMAGCDLSEIRNLRVGEFYEISPFCDLEKKCLTKEGNNYKIVIVKERQQEVSR